MKDKVVFITGAKGGLGSFVTKRFLATGATVVGASRSISKEDFLESNFVPLPVDFIKAAAVRDSIEQQEAVWRREPHALRQRRNQRLCGARKS